MAFWARGVLAAASLACLGAYAADPQDVCRIGAVGPEEYEAIKRRVAALPPVPWRKAVEAATSGSNPVLTQYLRRAIEPVAGADMRLATLHPVLQLQLLRRASPILPADAGGPHPSRRRRLRCR